MKLDDFKFLITVPGEAKTVKKRASCLDIIGASLEVALYKFTLQLQYL